MKTEDLKKGIVYTFHFNNEDNLYIGEFLNDGSKMLKSYICEYSSKVERNSVNSMGSGINHCREATYKEKSFYLRSIKAGKIVKGISADNLTIF